VTSNWILWLAQGLGVGRIPVAPGTWGSLLGLGWTAALLAAGHFGLFWIGLAGGFLLSVWACGHAERRLQRMDPPSVVLDEIAAVPLCYAGWITMVYWQTGHILGLAQFFRFGAWPVTLGLWAAFRFCDIVKPWPVRQSQSLPGGWGITVDDFLAAAYVNLGAGVCYFGHAVWGSSTAGR
jgi:phosphatidylglycerophosphatase A